MLLNSTPAKCNIWAWSIIASVASLSDQNQIYFTINSF